ncbi:MAG: type II secretion system protein [Victivallales bacterium]|nr:type II secretion system protein [Victivallales bacterium]
MSKNRKKAFTLVELMVAMAVLVIMMGFLFQFIISAQRLWSSSNSDTAIHTQAQIVFSMFETDLQNAIVRNDSGYAIPYLVTADAEDSAHYPIGMHHNRVYCCFLAQTSDLTGDAADMGASLIAYVFIRTNGDTPVYKLYRLILDDDFDYVNVEASDLYNKINDKISSIDNNSQNILAENVVDCNIQIRNTSATEATPKVARMTITFFDPDKIPNYEERIKSSGDLSSSDDRETKLQDEFNCTYSFSKIITLQ